MAASWFRTLSELEEPPEFLLAVSPLEDPPVLFEEDCYYSANYLILRIFLIWSMW